MPCKPDPNLAQEHKLMRSPSRMNTPHQDTSMPAGQGFNGMGSTDDKIEYYLLQSSRFGTVSTPPN